MDPYLTYFKILLFKILLLLLLKAQKLAGQIEWDRYRCDVPGVRWHPMGGWRVQFDRRDYEHNFFVKCSLARLLRVRGYENGFRNGRFGVRNGRVGVRNGRFGVRNGRFGDRNGRFGFRMGTKTIGYENDGKWRAKVCDDH